MPRAGDAESDPAAGGLSDFLLIGDETLYTLGGHPKTGPAFGRSIAPRPTSRPTGEIRLTPHRAEVANSFHYDCLGFPAAIIDISATTLSTVQEYSCKCTRSRAAPVALYTVGE